MSKRSSNRTTKPERSALVKLPASTPNLSLRELGLWKDYFVEISAPRVCTLPISIKQKDERPSKLLENFKNYYISNQVQITEHDTTIYVLRTYSGISVRSEYRIVDCFRLSDTKDSDFPKAIIALHYVKTPENDEPYLDRTLFVEEPLKADSKSSPVRGQQLGERFLLVAEDLEKEISYRFYVPGGQKSGPLYGQYVQDDALGSVDIEQLDQGRGRYKSTAVVWRKWEPLEDPGTEEWKGNNVALSRIVEERQLYVKPLLESHESSAGMRNSGRE
ncbi:hypothetical protein BELL_0615g00090 [Botrytis elliptica]|uniref:Uncharacterized protein n=1 Tax=Botrytis elliptica TaxID=278938 RepID=A0A4Z1JBN4_9HELO|nr:hypothetical protein EAE99_008660 [Botrytis elliptica]TGO71141.1 hypothetical protein BELL_0615g00090 [Botrytis elliptica]